MTKSTFRREDLDGFRNLYPGWGWLDDDDIARDDCIQCRSWGRIVRDLTSEQGTKSSTSMLDRYCLYPKTK
jgi:hypothetical protein